MSNHTLTSKSLNLSLKSLLKRGTQIGLSVSAFAPLLALANPTGGQVVAGTATIKNPNANTTVVKQSSASAIIDWQQFNIGKGQYVQFLQPSSSSVILNRVIGGGGSSIFGSLTGNGQVFLVNTNGVFFGKGASIDAQGFLASTLDIADSDFLSGHYLFDKGTNGDATVVNQGSITAHKGGYVVLAGDYAENDGLISAQSGHIVLASGSKSTLTLNGNSLISYAVNQATLANLAGANNAGKLSADGGTVIMTADVANLLKATVVNNTGLIEAHAISKNGGSIQLLATGGNIQNAGTLDASATHAGQQGGTITLKGDGRTTLTDASKIFATGDGANGGHVEVSGDTLSMRGDMKLGKGGNLLLDPKNIELTSGNTASTGSTNLTKVGINFIETRLGSHASVTFSASNTILASNNAKSLTATGTGNLKLKAGQGIELSGLDITIGGKLTASMGYGSFGHLTAGSIDLNAASRVVLPNATVTNGTVTAWSAKTTSGNLSIHAHDLEGLDSSAKATLALSAAQQLTLQATYGDASHERAGNLTLAGARIQAKDGVHVTGALNVTASNGYVEFGNGTASGDITFTDNGTSRQIRADHLSAGGKLTINDVNGGIELGGSTVAGGSYTLKAAKGISVNAKTITFSGTGNAVFRMLGGSGDITVHGAIGSSGTPSLAIGHGGATLVTTGNVSLDHRINVNGHVDIQAKGLAYTGTGALVLDAHGGGITLDASIGTAKAPVAYDVQLDANSGLIDIQRSIYTKGSIGVSESHQTIGLGAGVHVGNGDSTAIVLSAKGPISLKGSFVDIGADHGSGHDATITISADDANSKTSTDTLSITASNGSVYIQPSGNAIHGGTVAKATLDHSITLHAGQDVTISAAFGQVNIKGAGGSSSPSSFGMRAFGRGINTSISALGDINITAGHDIKVTGTSVDVRAGFTRADMASDSKAVATATAAADVNFTAGHDIDLTATLSSVTVAGGAAYGFAKAGIKGQKATAKASATTTFTAGHDIDLSGGSIGVTAGNHVGTGSGAFASASNAVANVTLDAGVSMQAANALTVKGTFVTLRGGNSDGGAAFFHPSSHTTAKTKVAATVLDASAKGATAAVNIDSALTLSAGKGGMTVSGAFVSISGGRNAAQAIQLSGSGSAAHVSDTVDASVTLASKANLTLKGTTGLKVRGGNGARTAESVFHSTSGAISDTSRNLSRITGRGDAVMALAVDTGVTLTATGILKATGGNFLTVQGGNDDGSNLQVNISPNGTKGSTKITLDGGVGFTAGAALSFGGKQVTVEGGADDASNAHINAYGGALTWNGDDGVALTGKSVALTSSGSGLSAAMHLTAGNGGQTMNVDAGNAAKVAVSLDQGLSITATNGNIIITGRSLNAGAGAGGVFARVAASNGATATLDENAALSFKASGLFSASFAGNNLSISGGNSGLQAAQVFAKAGGAVASATAEDSVSITAASAKLTASRVNLAAGRGANAVIFTGSSGTASGSSSAGAQAQGKATATLKESGAINVAVTGAFTVAATNIIDMRGAISNGYAAHAFATGAHAAGNVSADGSLNIKAGSVSMTAGNDVIVGEQSHDGVGAGAVAAQAGVATLTENSSVNITAAKTMVLDASHGRINIGLDRQMGREGVHAQSSAAATVSANDGVNLKAGSVAFSATDGISLNGGDVTGGSVTAMSKSKATFSDVAAVTITAATGFSAKLNGSASSGSIRFGGGGQTGAGAHVSGQTGGTAKMSVNAGVGISVTGTTGTVTIDTGKAITGAIDILGNRAGSSADVTANSGAASLGVTNGVSIAAKGAITLSNHNAILTIGDASSVGADAKTKASGLGGKAVSNVNDALSISGGSVTLTDTGSPIEIYGGHRFTSSSFSSDRAVASHYSAQAVGPKTTATGTVDASVSLKATGTLSLSAGGIQLNSVSHASNANLASHAKVKGQFGGKATLTANAGVSLAGANVTLQASTGLVGIQGQRHVAQKVQLQASSGGAATLTANAGTSIKATGTLTINAGTLDVSGGNSAGRSAQVKASGSGAKTAFTAQSAAALSAKTISINSLTGLSVVAGTGAGEAMSVHAGSNGANAVSLTSQVSISASGTLSIAAGGANIDAGQAVADFSTLDGDHGTDKVSITSNVALTAGGNMSLNMQGNGLVVIGDRAGTSQDVTAGAASTVTENISTNVVIKSGAKLSLANIDLLSMSAGSFIAPPVDTIGSGKVSGTLDGSISITGKSLSRSSIGSVNHDSGAGFTDNGLVAKSGITVTGGVAKLSTLSVQPLSLGTLQQHALIMSVETVLGAPLAAGQSTSYVPAPAAVGGARCEVSLLSDAGHCIVKR